jgi:hypothetical protein
MWELRLRGYGFGHEGAGGYGTDLAINVVAANSDFNNLWDNCMGLDDKNHRDCRPSDCDIMAFVWRKWCTWSPYTGEFDRSPGDDSVVAWWASHDTVRDIYTPPSPPTRRMVLVSLLFSRFLPVNGLATFVVDFL